MTDFTNTSAEPYAGNAPVTVTYSERNADVHVSESATPVVWSRTTLIAFRFCFVYFGLYILTTQMLPGMLPIPGIDIPDLGSFAVLQVPVVWFGAHVLHLAQPIQTGPSGSGDKLFDWTLALMTLIVATTSTIVWTFRSKGVTNHATLYKWFRFFMRWALATTMFSYGFAKVVPLQMPTVALTKLIEPWGDFTPMSVLWFFIGSSAPYEIFIGFAEVFAGALLFWPRTMLFGLLVTLMDAIGIFALNMTYDVPVKLFSFHLILFSLVLLAPNLRTLYSWFYLQKAAEPVREPQMGKTPQSHQRWTAAQVTFGVLAAISALIGSAKSWNVYGGGAPRPPFYGIWAVQQSVVDGVEQLPLLTDTTRFKHIVFQQATFTQMQRMNERFTGFKTTFDTLAKKLTFSTQPARKTPGDTVVKDFVFTYRQPTANNLILDGDWDGHKTHWELRLRPTQEFLQKKTGFHWVQQNPNGR
ncbi:MAG: hypothetical protein ABJB66_09015 [Gemmatimonadaceae bacterium]